MSNRVFDKNSIKLAAFDLDGTIFDFGVLLKETREAILRLSESGVATVISTGRHPYFLPQEVMDIPCFRYAVASDGAIVADIRTREIFSIREMSIEKTVEVAQILASMTDIMHVVFRDNGISTRADAEVIRRYFKTQGTGDDGMAVLKLLYEIVDDAQALAAAIDRPAVKFGCRFADGTDIPERIEYLRAQTGIEVVATDNGLVELSPPGVNKGVGLEALCERLSLRPENVIVFGDSGNDAEIMKRAGYRVAMGNASDDIKAIADYVTDTVREDGVGKAIRRLFGV